VSHTATCLDDHIDVHLGPTTSVFRQSEVRSSERTPRTSIAAVYALGEVRWASAATVLFASALLLRMLGSSAWVSAAPFAACYLAGGWEPALTGLSIS
jgi:hypothetical protein